MTFWDKYMSHDTRRIEPLEERPGSYVVLDTETTGLHPWESSLTEIGAILVVNGKEVGDFEQLIDPGEHIPEKISELTGITDDMVAGQPGPAAAMRRLHSWLDAGDLVAREARADGPLPILAHNAVFDLGFLDHAEHAAWPDRFQLARRYLCIKEMSWEIDPDKHHHRVADLIVDFGIGDEEEHRALFDARQEHRIYLALCAEADRRGLWDIGGER